MDLLAALPAAAEPAADSSIMISLLIAWSAHPDNDARNDLKPTLLAFISGRHRGSPP